MSNVEKRYLKVAKLKLWAHQKSAIREILEYLDSDSKQAYLVKMPTGTGKTGVFSALMRLAKDDMNYLVISPSTAIKEQVLREVENDFWTKIKYDKDDLSSYEIRELLPKNSEETLSDIKGKKFILVTTIQALQMIYSVSTYKKRFRRALSSV